METRAILWIGIPFPHRLDGRVTSAASSAYTHGIQRIRGQGRKGLGKGWAHVFRSGWLYEKPADADGREAVSEKEPTRTQRREGAEKSGRRFAESC